MPAHGDARQVPPALREPGVIAILRRVAADRTLGLARALHAGGIRAVEVTLNTEGAIESIGRLKAALPAGTSVGAGTVMTSDEVRAAVDAGAEFIVCPHTDEEVVRAAVALGVPALPGAFTASEVVRAWRAGASMVKLFPASAGGPAYIRELRGPLGQIPLVATGGVTLDNAAAFVRAGAAALGVGSSLTPRDLIAAGDWDGIARLAARFVEAVRTGRAP